MIPEHQTILDALRENNGYLTVASLVKERVRKRGHSESVARSSISRTLQRMWRRGLVELSDGRETATQNQEAEPARQPTTHRPAR